MLFFIWFQAICLFQRILYIYWNFYSPSSIETSILTFIYRISNTTILYFLFKYVFYCSNNIEMRCSIFSSNIIDSFSVYEKYIIFFLYEESIKYISSKDIATIKTSFTRSTLRWRWINNKKLFLKLRKTFTLRTDFTIKRNRLVEFLNSRSCLYFFPSTSLWWKLNFFRFKPKIISSSVSNCKKASFAEKNVLQFNVLEKQSVVRVFFSLYSIVDRSLHELLWRACRAVEGGM